MVGTFFNLQKEKMVQLNRRLIIREFTKELDTSYKSVQIILTDNLQMRLPLSLWQRVLLGLASDTIIFCRKKCSCLFISVLLSGFSTKRLLGLQKNKNRVTRKTFWRHSRHWEGYNGTAKSLPEMFSITGSTLG